MFILAASCTSPMPGAGVQKPKVNSHSPALFIVFRPLSLEKALFLTFLK
jgi:hypothetical protein